MLVRFWLNKALNKKRLPLRTVIFIPIILEIIGVIGIVGYLSFQNGQKSINNLSNQLLSSTTNLVQENIKSYTNLAIQLNKFNLKAIQERQIDLKNPEEILKVFYNQVFIFEKINFIYWGDRNGNFSGISRIVGNNDSISIVVSNQSTNYHTRFYEDLGQGKKGKILQESQKKYDPRIRPWYKIAEKEKQLTWTKIYGAFDSNIRIVTNSNPIYDEEGVFQGVIGVDVYSHRLNNFLKKIEIGKKGQIFITDRSGFLVASSTETSEYFHQNNTSDEKFKITNINDKINREVSKFLLTYFDNNLNLIKEKLSFKLKLEQENYFVQVSPIKDNYGLDWLIIIVVPESDFMEQIHANNRNTFILCIIALIFTIFISDLISKWIAIPILKLNKAAKEISAGNLQQTIQINRSDEVGQLSKSFNLMAAQLKESFAKLKAKNEDLKENERRLSDFLEAMPVGVFVTDTKGKPIYVNKAGKTILGKGVIESATLDRLSEVYNAYIADTNFLYPTVKLPITQALLGHKDNKIEDLEVRRHHADGEEINFLLEANATPVYNKEGDLIHAIVVFQDIRERKEAQKLLADYNHKLEIQVKQRTEELSQTIDVLKATKAKLVFENQLLQESNLQEFEYQINGTLPANSPTYVVRNADRQLYRNLKKNKFSYVFNARQMGKSSLAIKVLNQLKRENYTCLTLDFTEIGSDEASLEQWYVSIILVITKKLNLDFNYRDWWLSLSHITTVQRFSKFFDEIILEQISGFIVIFFDEIDSVLALNFPTNDFFAIIRSFHNKRAEDPKFNRLTFVFLGKTSPSELIQDPHKAPFNIGEAIYLEGFKLDEVKSLEPGLKNKCDRPYIVLEEILKWTKGQPMLTQKICNQIVRSENLIPSGQESELVENLVNEKIITNWEAQDFPGHFTVIRDILLEDKNSRAMLKTYLKVLNNCRVEFSSKSNIHSSLILLGIVKLENGQLKSYNPIYEKIFNINWLEQNLKL